MTAHTLTLGATWGREVYVSTLCSATSQNWVGLLHICRTNRRVGVLRKGPRQFKTSQRAVVPTLKPSRL